MGLILSGPWAYRRSIMLVPFRAIGCLPPATVSNCFCICVQWSIDRLTKECFFLQEPLEISSSCIADPSCLSTLCYTLGPEPLADSMGKISFMEQILGF